MSKLGVSNEFSSAAHGVRPRNAACNPCRGGGRSQSPAIRTGAATGASQTGAATGVGVVTYQYRRVRAGRGLRSAPFSVYGLRLPAGPGNRRRRRRNAAGKSGESRQWARQCRFCGPVGVSEAFGDLSLAFPGLALECSCSAIHLTASYSATKPLMTPVSPSGHRISTSQPDPGFFRAPKVGRCSDMP